jgi:hypothetical protein
MKKCELNSKEFLLKRQQNGSRKHKHLKNYSDSFNKMFTFFLQSYRSKILDFCGVDVNVTFDINGSNGKFCFRLYDNGEQKLNDLKSKHSNIVQGVIVGKKSWGLFLNEWTDGIAEGSFSSKEIFQQFDDNNIKIPDSLYADFYNRLNKKLQSKINTSL